MGESGPQVREAAGGGTLIVCVDGGGWESKMEALVLEASRFGRVFQILKVQLMFAFRPFSFTGIGCCK